MRILASLLRFIFALRLRLKRRKECRSLNQSETGLRADIDDLAERQIRMWRRQHSLKKSSIAETYARLNTTSISVFVFNVERGRIRIAEKPPPPPVPTQFRQEIESAIKTFRDRALYYKLFLEHIFAIGAINTSMKLAVDVNDIGIESMAAPLFAFQKRTESSNILLPDVDFFFQNWYSGRRDSIRYDDKRIMAGFIGSSTGGRIDIETILKGRNPRLRAAAYFLDSSFVDFRIANVVQVNDAAAKSLIESQRYFSHRIGWRSQFHNRFLISMDGNGAACSRLAIGLKSQCAVIKYASPFSLFYFPKLVAGRDYVPVLQDAEVEQIVQMERAKPGSYRTVAKAGQSFFDRYLRRDRVIAYTATLLGKYADFYAALPE